MTDNYKLKTIEACYTPALFQYILTKDNYIVVIVDILRATTAICTALKNGALEVVPVANIVDTQKYKRLGYMVAGERDGIVIDGADFGNSPFNFTEENVKGKKIVITTTNGTQTIKAAQGAEMVILGAFSNISVLTGWLVQQDKNIVILCSGWKNKFCLEDSLFAGVLSERLMQTGYTSNCDSVAASLELWKIAKTNILPFIEKASHRHRLKKLGLDDVIEYCFSFDSAPAIPFLNKGALINVLKKV